MAAPIQRVQEMNKSATRENKAAPIKKGESAWKRFQVFRRSVITQKVSHLITIHLILCMVAGFTLGSTPYIKELLHFRFEDSIIPIGSVLFGILIFYIQFSTNFLLKIGPYKLSLKIGLIIAAMIGYFFIDVGIYNSANVSFYSVGSHNNQSILPDRYPLSEFLTFRQYIICLFKKVVITVKGIDIPFLGVVRKETAQSYINSFLGVVVGLLLPGLLLKVRQFLIIKFRPTDLM